MSVNLVRIRRCLAFIGWAGALAWFGVPHPVAWADAPAVTDFGQDIVQPVHRPAGGRDAAEPLRCALFLTWTADGVTDVQLRWIRDDAVVGFSGAHPAWQPNEGLRWYLQMPVYERHLTREQAAADRIEV
jgi:hypothetical protein